MTESRPYNALLSTADSQQQTPEIVRIVIYINVRQHRRLSVLVARVRQIKEIPEDFRDTGKTALMNAEGHVERHFVVDMTGDEQDVAVRDVDLLVVLNVEIPLPASVVT